LPPASTIRAEGWQVVTCPFPWLARSPGTVGLGDTFLAGMLLVLGRIGEDTACRLASLASWRPASWDTMTLGS